MFLFSGGMSSDGGGMGAGIFVGAGVGGAALVVGIIAVVIYCYLKARKEKSNTNMTKSSDVFATGRSVMAIEQKHGRIQRGGGSGGRRTTKQSGPPDRFFRIHPLERHISKYNSVTMPPILKKKNFGLRLSLFTPCELQQRVICTAFWLLF